MTTKFSKSFTTGSFPSVTTFARSLSTGFAICGRRSSGSRRSAISGDQDRGRRQSPFRGIWVSTDKHWSSAGPIRRIFKVAFTAAGLPYFNPHSFRKTSLLGEKSAVRQRNTKPGARTSATRTSYDVF